jgi:hypothetical protein
MYSPHSPCADPAEAKLEKRQRRGRFSGASDD